MKLSSQPVDKNAASHLSSLGPGIDEDGPSPWIHSSSSTHPFINSTMLFPYSKPTIFQQITGPIRGFLPSLRRGRQSSRDPDGIIAPRSPGGTRILQYPRSNALRSYPTSPSRSHGSDHQLTPPDRLSVDSPHHSTFQHEASARGTPFLASPPRRSTTEGTGRLAASASGASPRPGRLGSRIPLQRSGSMVTDTQKDQSLLNSSEGRSESPDTSGF
jgi:hypothetical protein